MNLGRVYLLILTLALGACETSPEKKENPAEERAKIAALNTQLAVAYMRDNENELALKKLAKALDADPKYVDAHNTYALLYSRLGNVQKAEQSYKDALRIDPINPSALNNYGQFLCQQKRYDEGQAKFLEAIKNPLYRSPENALTNAGLCALQAKNLEVAEQHFRNALQIDAELAPALYSMAQLSYDKANYLQARGYHQRFVQVAPQTARSLWLGIRIEHALHDKDAESSYSLVLKNKFPDAPETGFLQQGKFD